MQSNYILIVFIGLVVGLGYAWRAAQASGLVPRRTAVHVMSAGKRGRRQPPPDVASGGSSASEGEAGVSPSSNLRILAEDSSKLVALKVAFFGR